MDSARLTAAQAGKMLARIEHIQLQVAEMRSFLINLFELDEDGMLESANRTIYQMSLSNRHVVTLAKNQLMNAREISRLPKEDFERLKGVGPHCVRQVERELEAIGMSFRRD